MFMIGLGPWKAGMVTRVGRAHLVSDTNFEKVMSWSFCKDLVN